MAIINGKDVKADFIEVGEFFPYVEPRAGDPKQIVFHESVGTRDPFNFLKLKGYGVHFVIMGDGKIIQHADPFTRLKHAGGLNEYGVGIEIVNPYTSVKGVWNKIINAKWAWKGKYTVPTLAQVESTKKLVDFLTQNIKTIPNIVVYPYAMGAVKGADFNLGGLWSHQWGKDHHADGSFITLFMQLINEGNDVKSAYNEAINKATTLNGDTSNIEPKTMDAQNNSLNNDNDGSLNLDPVKIIKNLGIGVTLLGVGKVSLDILNNYLKNRKKRR